MDDVLQKLWDKSDTHDVKFNESEKVAAVTEHRLTSLERSSDQSRNDIISTKTELVALITNLSLTLHQIQQVQAEDRGARQTRKQDINYFLEFIRILPTLSMIIGGVYLYMQK